jgi:hypothetical protein
LLDNADQEEAMGYVLTLLVSVSSRHEFVEKLVNEQHILVPALLYQATRVSVTPIPTSTDKLLGEVDSQTEVVAVLAHNLSLLPEFTSSISSSPKLTEMFVNSLKALYKGDSSEDGEIRILALTSLVNFTLQNRYCNPSLKSMLYFLK